MRGHFLRAVSRFDSDAAAYIAAVQAADGQALESGVVLAINNFVTGCKADGIWAAIKACCILAGARTLNGALVPLVGAAPTNYNFVSGDYNRKTGLKGNGSTKYLNSNRNESEDPRNDQHISIYITSAFTALCCLAGSGDTGTGNSQLIGFASPLQLQFKSRDVSSYSGTLSDVTGLMGVSRSSSSSFSVYGANGAYTATVSGASVAPATSVIHIFQRPTVSFPSDAAISFYSVGSSLNLSLLKTRVLSLMNDLSTAIP